MNSDLGIELVGGETTAPPGVSVGGVRRITHKLAADQLSEQDHVWGKKNGGSNMIG